MSKKLLYCWPTLKVISISVEIHQIPYYIFGYSSNIAIPHFAIPNKLFLQREIQYDDIWISLHNIILSLLNVQWNTTSTRAATMFFSNLFSYRLSGWNETNYYTNTRSFRFMCLFVRNYSSYEFKMFRILFIFVLVIFIKTTKFIQLTNPNYIETNNYADLSKFLDFKTKKNRCFY